MFKGGFIASGPIVDYDAPFNLCVFLCCVAASFGGLLFGYDLGIAGGVCTMQQFTYKFFPSVWDATYGPEKDTIVTSTYCKYNNQLLQLFQSSLYLAALFAAIGGAWTSRKYGRKFNMISAACSYIVGAALNGAAVHTAMLIVGRLLLGVGVGLANSSVTVYANEIAPPKWRGALNQLFQLCTTVGIIVAGIINWAIGEVVWGWRLSLALAAVPGTLMLVCSSLLPESPTSLLERNIPEKARQNLQKIRGRKVDVTKEFETMVYQTTQSREMQTSFSFAFQKCYLPYHIMSFVIAIGQQLTGINAIMFYAPVIFSTIGSGHESALLNTTIIGAVNVVATFVSIFLVDRLGRRFFYFVAGIFMFIFELVCGLMIMSFFKSDGGSLTPAHASAVLAIVCLYVANFAWSYGPFGWLVTSEIQPSEIRTIGMSMATSWNMLGTFFIGQFFLQMMCSLEWGVFVLFACFCIAQAFFLFGFLPETRGRHQEEIHEAFAQHWFWGRFPQPSRPERIEGIATPVKQQA